MKLLDVHIYAAIIVILVVCIVFLANCTSPSQAELPTNQLERARLTETKLSDGTPCAVVIGQGLPTSVAITCGWKPK